MPVRWLLELRSSEAENLLCSAAHVAGHPQVCPGQCQHTPGATVQDAVAVKDPVRVGRWRVAVARGDVPAVQVENGYLVDGHHRVAAAVDMGVAVLPVRAVTGVLVAQQSWHAVVARDAFGVDWSRG